MNPLYHAFLALSASSAILFGLANPALGQIDPPATIFWTGSSNSSWGLDANWNPARVPLASDHVEISTANATVNLDVSANLASLRLGQTNGTGTQTLAMAFGTTLTLATNSTVNARGLLQLASGTVNGPGLLKADGTIEWTGGTLAGKAMVGASGTLRMLGSGTKMLSSDDNANPAAITNLGLVVWTNSAAIYLRYGAQIVNQATWRLEGDGDPFYYDIGDVPGFDNQGTFLKASGVGLTSLGYVSFTNTATVTVQSGTLRFDRATHWANGCVFNGPGNVLLNTTVTSAGTPVLNTTVELMGGTVIGSFDINGPFPLIWSAGTISGRLTVKVGGLLQLTSSGTKLLSSDDNTNPAAITNLGLVVWTNSNQIYLRYGAQIVNQATWRLEGDGDPFYYDMGDVPGFNNQGTFLKASGSGLTSLGYVSFTNTATVTVQSGTLRFDRAIHLANGCVFNGPGNVLLNTTVTSAGTPVLNTAVEIMGGTVIGSFDINGPFPLIWSAGTIFGRLTVKVGGLLQLSGSGTKLLSSDDNANPAAITNQGLVVWTNSNQLYLRYGAQIVNQATWRLDSDGTPFYYDAGIQPVFLNRGILAKAPTAGTAVINYVLFQNEGTLSIPLGALQLESSTTLADSSVVNVSVGGPTPLTAYGQLVYNGAGTLNGKILVTLANGFTPTNGQTFTVVSGSSLTGSFSTQSLPALPAGLVWTVDQNPGSIVLRIENQQPCVSLSAGALAWWPAENSGFDLAGSNNLAFTNGVSFAAGRVGRAFSFSGNHDSAFSTSPSLTNAADSFTMEFWAYPTASHAGTSESASGIQGAGGQRYAIFPEWGGSENAGAGVSVGIEGVSVFEHGDSYLPSLLVYNTPISGWTHIAVVYLNKTPSLYINGAWVRTGLISQRAHVFPSKNLGDTSDYGPYAGLLDDVAIFNRALSSNEVVAIYQAGSSGFCNTNALPLPDLAVTGVTSPPTAFMGQAVPLVYSLSNLGRVPAPGPWVNQIVIATNAAGAAAQSIGSAIFSSEIAAGSSVTLTQSVILPAGVFGARFLGVIADSGNNVAELNESNNTAYAATAITITAADLVVGNVSAPSSVQFGQALSVSFAVTNRGNANASASWNDQIFLGAASNALAGATLLATVPGSPLNAGASYSRTQAVTLPLVTGLPAGPYFLVIAADADNAQAESDEGNNLISRAITLSYASLPDLVVGSVTAPLLVGPGSSVPISWTVRNQGTLGATGEWSEVVSISNVLVGALSLAEFRYTNLLALGQQLVRTQTVVVPASLLAGDWQFIVRTDSRFEVFESNEANNSTAATNLSQVPAKLTLALPQSELSEGASLLATITRNGDPTLPLSVTVTNSDPSELDMTNRVVIPAGQASATFDIDALLDGVVDGPKLVSVGATATGYPGATASLTVLDVDIPLLTLVFGAPTVTEGLTVPVTVSRDYATNLPLLVAVAGFDPTHLIVPNSVTIPANQLSYTFAVLAVDDDQIEPPQTRSVTVSAAGYQSAIASVVVMDNDLPSVSLVLARKSVSEGAGPQATSVTITRTPVSAHTLTLELTSSDPGLVLVPATATLAAGQTSVSFPIGVVDDSLVNGTRNVTLRVFIRDTFGNVIAEGTPDTLEILDDDGPTLKLAIARDVVPEGENPATTAIVTRNTATNTALTVTLASSDTKKLTVPANVVIPAGANAVSVNLVSLLNGITDGNKTVIVTASAAGFTLGSDVIVVTDIDLPDFVIANVIAPTNGVTDANFTISYRIENRGISPSTTPFVTRVFLSTDTFVGGDTLLGEFPFTGTLPVNLFIEQTSQFRLPSAAGRYWVIIVADAANQVTEALENNNTFVSALPIEVTVAYTATVQTSVTTAPAGTAVPLSGSAVRADTGLPAVNVPVNVHVVHGGMRRLFAVQTDINGNFTTTFTPLPGEAGLYEIGAAYPSAAVAPIQDTFTIVGIRANPPSLDLKLAEQSSVTGQISLENLGDSPLTQLSVAIVDNPAVLNVTAQIGNNGVLPASGSVPLAYAITALQSPNRQSGTMRLRVTATNGVSLDIPLNLTIEPLRPRLVANPVELLRSPVRGRQVSVEFEVANEGGAASGPLQISLPPLSWLSLASTNPAPSLAPGETNRVTLLLNPPADAPLTEYTGNLAINGTNSSLAVPVRFRTISTAVADLRIIAEDEFTYFAVGAPHVTNAVVTLSDTVTHTAITNGPANVQGEFLVSQLPEGYYDLEVKADKHESFKQTVLLTADQTNEVHAFLSLQLVTYNWTVTPVATEDRYRITIETTFEANVPAPVVTLSPTSLDLGTLEFVNGIAQVSFTLENHGLIAAQAAQLKLPGMDEYEFTTLVTNVGLIAANSSLVVPVQIKKKRGIIETLSGPVIAAGNSPVVAFVPPPPTVTIPPPLDRGALSLNNPSSGSLANGQAVLYRVDVPPGETLEVVLDSAPATGTNDVYIRFGEAPTQTLFDLSTGDSTSPDARLVVPTTQVGTYYVLVYARNMPASPSSYSLTASRLAFGITRTSTRLLGTSGPATLGVEGARFDEATRMVLIGQGQTNFPVNFEIRDAATAVITFNLVGTPAGFYDLYAIHVTNGLDLLPDGQLTMQLAVATRILLPRYIQVVDNQPGALAAKVLLPEKVQFGREFAFAVLFTNSGATDLSAPLVRISGKNQMAFTPETNALEEAGFDAVAAISGNLSKTTLAPGESVLLNFYGHVSPGVNAYVEVQDLSQVTGPINWSEFEAFYQTQLTPENWNETWASFTQSAGNTLSSFRTALAAGLVDYPASPGTKAVSGDALLFQLLTRSSPVAAPVIASVTESSPLSRSIQKEAYQLQSVGLPPLPGLETGAPVCFDWRIRNWSTIALRLLKVPAQATLIAALKTVFGEDVAGIYAQYLDYDAYFNPNHFPRQYFRDGGQVVEGRGVMTGFRNSKITKDAVNKFINIDIKTAIRNCLTNCQLDCSSMPAALTLEELFNKLPDKGAEATNNFNTYLNYHDDGMGIPTIMAGGKGGSFRGTKDVALLHLKESRVKLKPQPGKCGTLNSLSITTELVIEYQDSIDFCPGGRSECPWNNFLPNWLGVAGHIIVDDEVIWRSSEREAINTSLCPNQAGTIFLQILESYELAYAVPFSVIFKETSGKGLMTASFSPLDGRYALKGVCPQKCCPVRVGLDYSYPCGGNNVAKQAQSFVNNSKCKEKFVPDCQITGQGFAGLPQFSNSGDFGGTTQSSSGIDVAYNTDAPCTPQSATASAVSKPISAKAAGEVCAKVKLRLDQDLVTTRDAFQATLEIVNNTPSALEGIQVLIVVRNQNGEDATELFGIRAPTLDGLSGVTGSGVVSGDSTGKASWVLIPTIDAATNGPTQYYVSGSFAYTLNGLRITVPLAPAPITALPCASLVLKYFHQRDVFADDPYTPEIEPSIPYSLAIMIQNNGKGAANNLRITSGQPKIVDNEKGLLIDFQIIGTEVAGQSVSPSLTASFGNILPNTIAIARWLFTSTLQGLFIDYKATFEHLDAIGNKRLSIIDHVEIHEMIHLVQAAGAFEDGWPDFLVNDVPDPDDLPDTLYFSDGTTAPVQAVTTAKHDGAPTAGNLAVQLTAAMPSGWTYLRVPDPGNGAARLTRVARSDGVEIAFGTNVWTTDRTFIGQGRRPITENRLHLLDFDSPGSYTLYYTVPPPPDTNAPSSLVLALPANNYSEFPVHWTGTDGLDGSGISSFDVYVSVDGGPFNPWLQRTPLTSSVYQGQTGHAYAFYSIATDVSGNREAAPLAAHTQTATTLTNTRPTVTLPATITLNEGQTLSITPVTTDADPDQTLTFALLSGAPVGVLLNTVNGQITWVTDEANGPSTNQIRLTVTDNGQPPLSATGTVSVIVNEVNSAPTLEAVSDRTINELQNLSIPLAAHDTDLPVQTLTFSLGAGAPRGASLNASNGVFSWTPDSTQGPSTNRIQVSVRDSGVPVLSASQTFTVIVRDSRPDFVVSFGSTNVYAGQSGQVPLNLQSGLDLTNVSLFLELNATALTNLTLSPAAAAVGSASLSPAGPQLYQIRLVPVAGEVLQGAGEFARLFFATSTNVPSALVYLKPTEVTGVRSTGDLVPNGGGVSGRIIVVNREPVLVAHDGVPHTIDIFARPGMTYTLEYSTNGTAPWLPLNALTHGADILTTIAVQTVGGNVIYQLIAP